MVDSKFILFITFIGIFSMLQIRIAGQNNNSDIEHFTIENGLSQSIINCVMQDSQGYLWIGTQDGLNKHDGYSFKKFRHAPLDSTSISSNIIQSVCEDKQGNLWIATQNGLNNYNTKTGKFQRFFHEPENPNSLKDNNVLYVYEDNKGRIWMKTLDFISCLNTQTKKFTHYIHTRGLLNYSFGNNYFSIIEDFTGTLWAGTNNGLNYFNKEKQMFEAYTHNRNNPYSISNDEIRCLFEDSDGNLWIGTSEGLNKFDRKTSSFERFYYDKNRNNYLKNNIINSICDDHTGLLWIGTETGIKLFDRKKNQFINNVGDVSVDQEIEKIIRSISCCIRDNSKIIWVGTDTGLYKINRKKKKFKLYKKTGNNEINFSDNDILAVYADTSNILWLGTRNSGINLFDRSTNSMKYLSTENSNLPDNMVQVIYSDNSGNIWIGTGNGAVFCNAVNLQLHNIDDKKRVFYQNTIYSIIEDKQQNIWFGTQKGLHKLVKESNNMASEIISYYQSDSSIHSNTVYSLFEDKNGNIWIGTRKGLSKYNTRTDRFISYEKRINSQKGLSHNSVLSLFEDSHGILWIGTESGLNKFHRYDETFSFYTQENGFFNDHIYEILEDTENNLWVSTNRGIAKFDTETEDITNYHLIDGLQGYEFNLGAALIQPNGEIFFGGKKGLNAFFPDSLNINTFAPKVKITSIEIVNKTGTKEILINEQNELRLSYLDYMFTINFAMLEFTNPSMNNFEYMMEGMKDGWIRVRNEHSVTFPSIPGEYIFRIKGANSDMQWNNETTNLRIIINSPYYNTHLAYFLYIVFSITIVFLIINLRTKNLRKANQILKEKEKAGKKIAKQREELAIKNKNITDSINYAKRIIDSMMPSESTVKKILPESFILFLPKDIVSGDFYWITEQNNKIYVAAVDCTGHGVPGAFMSIIGYDLLRNIVEEQGIDDPSEILEKLSDGVARTFGNDIDNLPDGMDLAFCVIDKTKNLMQYSGAFNPLYLVRDNNILEIKGDRFPVGIYNNSDKSQHFHTHTIQLRKDDVFYIFSDGYVDQFGGPTGKKFKHRRFRRLLLSICSLPMEKQKSLVLKSFDIWKRELEQVDDILVIGVRPYNS